MYDCDSMCSMSFTVVVMARSKIVTMRFSISSGEMPPYVQTTLTTGMSIYGKISTGMRDNRAAAQNGDQHRHHDEGIRAA